MRRNGEKNTGKTPLVLLSVDFDYFVREETEWDWGHRESEDNRENLTYLYMINEYVSRYGIYFGDGDIMNDLIRRDMNFKELKKQREEYRKALQKFREKRKSKEMSIGL